MYKRDNCLKSLDKAVGAKLKQLRKAKGYQTQENFAVALDTERANVARWEAGIFRPSPDMLARILEVLNIKEEDLWPTNAGSIPPDITDRLATADDFELEAVRAVLGIRKAKAKPARGETA